MTGKFETLTEGIRRAFTKNASRPCLDVGDEIFSYSEIEKRCLNIAETIEKFVAAEEKFAAFLSYRSVNAYVSVYGILCAGKAYLPLNPKFPLERTLKVLELSSCKTILLGEECIDKFVEFADSLENLTIICLGQREKFDSLSNRFPKLRFVFPKNKSKDEINLKVNVKQDDAAYLLYTSGSTGTPKGVLVSHENVCSYAAYTIEHYKVSDQDRLTQLPDLTFDLSVNDLFVSILSGACLCVVPDKSVMAPAKFIKDKSITFWTSVPSVVMFMAKMRMLKPNSYPTIRCSMFCGEALPAKSAELWQIAAPNSLIENTYGPTEATVAITNYLWNSETSPDESVNGIVPIGYPFEGQKVIVIDENNSEVENGVEGEICLGGSQITLGYLNDEEKTNQQFVFLEDKSAGRWYKTGDLAKKDDDGCLYYLGRIDEQVKIRGYRVELQEIDRILGKVSQKNAVAVPYSIEQGAATTVYGFVEGEEDREFAGQIISQCRKHLPDYMVPSKIIFVESIPVNVNGKINRKALIENNNE